MRTESLSVVQKVMQTKIHYGNVIVIVNGCAFYNLSFCLSFRQRVLRIRKPPQSVRCAFFWMYNVLVQCNQTIIFKSAFSEIQHLLHALFRPPRQEKVVPKSNNGLYLNNGIVFLFLKLK
jgi:hypothetical protein